MFWNCRLLLPVPERYCTSMAGMYSGGLKALPARSPALRTAPMLRLTLAEGEGAVAGLEVAAGVDDDLGVVCRWADAMVE